MALAVIAFGANLGDRQQTLKAAARAVAELPETSWVSGSSLYESTAIGPNQPDYLNAVALIDTKLPPAELLAALHRIEADHGRVRLEHWGPRTLDLDLVDYEGFTSEDASLRVPHPFACERAFVCVPLAEISGDWQILGREASDLAAELASTELRRVHDRGWWL